MEHQHRVAIYHVDVFTFSDIRTSATMTPEEIKALREHTEMTQVQMAQLFRVSPTDVMAWENGTLEPDREELALLERLRASGTTKTRYKFNK
jgi:DNA-binding transcriptional regulator YiaG